MLWIGVPNVCKNAEDKSKLEAQLRMIQTRLNAYEGNPEPELPFHLRSVGAQTSADLLKGSYNLENPFYKNDEDFVKGDE